jgi:CRISPR-associated protein Csm4
VTDLFFRSDTLSSALLSIAASLGENVDNLVEEGWFKVSSFLPVVHKGSGWCVFYPVPDAFKEALAQKVGQKQVKNFVFADDEFLKCVIRGQAELRGQVLVKGKKLTLLDLANKDSEGKVQAVVNVRMGLAVDRLTGGPIEDMLFEVGDIIPDPSLRVCIIADVESKRLQQFERYLRILGMSGIGSSKSRGRGQFEVLVSQKFDPPDLGSGAHLLLSLWHPTKEEFSNGFMAQSFYRLIPRGGFVTKAPYMTLRRNRVTMVREGSIIKGVQPRGHWLVALGKGEAMNIPYAVYRDGRALSIPISPPRSLRGAP